MIRIGLASGSVFDLGADASGMAVAEAARVMSTAGAGSHPRLAIRHRSRAGQSRSSVGGGPLVERPAASGRDLRAGAAQARYSSIKDDPHRDSSYATTAERGQPVGIMPYHLEKGHYLLLLEETLNEGIEAVVDDDTAITFPGPGPSVLDAGVHARGRRSPVRPDQGESEADGLLDVAGVHDRLRRRVPDLRDHRRELVRVPVSQRTGASTRTASEQADRACGTATRATSSESSPTSLVRALEVSLGLDHDAPLPTAAPPRSWPHLLLLQMPATVLRGLDHLAVPQRQSSGGRAGDRDLRDARATTIRCRTTRCRSISTTITRTTSCSTLRNDGEFLEEPVTAPAADPDRQAAPRRVGGHTSRSQEAQRLRHLRSIELSGMGTAVVARSSPRRTSATSSRSSRRPAVAESTNTSRSTWRHEQQKDRTFDLAVAIAAVGLDVAGVLGEFLDGRVRPGSRPSEKRRGAATTASSSRCGGGSTAPTRVGSRVSGTPSSRPTGNNDLGVRADAWWRTPSPASRSTISTSCFAAGTVVFQRFIDWLAVFAQLGVLHLGRPMSIGDIRFVPPDRGTTRRRRVQRPAVGASPRSGTLGR